MFSLSSNEKRLVLIEDRFMRHMALEEETMSMLRDSNTRFSEKLDEVTQTLSKLDAKIDRNNVDTDLRIATASEQLKQQIAETYARRDELNDAMNSLRSSVRIAWSAIVCFFAVLAWVVDKIPTFSS